MPDAELDIEDFDALRAYLRATGRIAPDESPRLVNLAGGVSNRTVLLERPGGESWVLKQALQRLRVRVDWRSDPRRIEREAEGMVALGRVAPPGAIPRLIFLDPACHLLAMEAVPSPHENWKTMLMAGRLEADHVRRFAELLAVLHAAGNANRHEFAAEFDDRSAFESLRLEPYYLYAAERAPAAARFLRELVERTRETRQTLVHGDYSPKNVLVTGERLILLDHEVIHFGDGAFDIGFAMTHLLSKANALPIHRDRFAVAANSFWTIYRGALGEAAWAGDLESRAVRHLTACLLARCIGRSPLEYLTPPMVERQTAAALAMISHPPASIPEAIGTFREHLK